MVWVKEQKSLLWMIRIERELSELLGIKVISWNINTRKVFKQIVIPE